MNLNDFWKYIVICLGITSIPTTTHAQISISKSSSSIADVLDEVGKQVSINYSYSSSLSNCIFEIDSTFQNAEETINFVAKHCNLDLKFINSTYVFSPKKANSKQKILILDALNFERLPLTSIRINEYTYSPNEQGLFNIPEFTDLIFFSHIGYKTTCYSIDQITDTIFLSPEVTNLSDFNFSFNVTEREDSAKNGTWLNQSKTEVLPSPIFKINHRVAQNIPTTSNTLFSLLRLQPGVLAAGEQTQDFLIWGSNKGESAIIFDHIPLFRTTTLDENISSISPIVIKDLSLYKGGYNIDFTNRVGGIVDIKGINGQSSKWHNLFNLNNRILSGQSNIPINRNSNLLISGRTTISENLKIESNIKKDSLEFEQEHIFRDLNLKWNFHSNNSKTHLQFNFLGSLEEQEESFNDENNDENNSYRIQKNTQNGQSLILTHNWDYQNETSVILSRSALNLRTSNSFFDSDSIESSSFRKNSRFNFNTIESNRINIKHLIYSKKNQIQITAGVVQNNNFSKSDTSDFKTFGLLNQNSRLEFSIKPTINLKKLNLSPSILTEYDLSRTSLYTSPRITGNIKILRHLNFHFGGGIYRQYITEVASIDQFGNAYYEWETLENSDNPLRSEQIQSKLLLEKSGWTASIEGYLKRTSNLKRHLLGPNLTETSFYGENKSQGLDFYVKKSSKRLDIWTSYTLSKVLEHFSYFAEDNFLSAPQNQLHEFKFAFIYKLDNLSISTNYVYGSGITNNFKIDKLNQVPYHRWDGALMYKFSLKALHFESGFSILNILNHYNIRMNSFVNLPNNRTIFSPATPRTFSFFLNLSI